MDEFHVYILAGRTYRTVCSHRFPARPRVVSPQPQVVCLFKRELPQLRTLNYELI
jgi:spermidine synthase